jgi:hypothetical protein
MTQEFVICPRNQIIFEAIVLYDLMRLPHGSQILGMGLFTLAFLGHPFKAGHFAPSMTCREGLMTLPWPRQLVDL